jgi:hypothetical protein
MKRVYFYSAVVLCAALVSPVLRADVKTREHTSFSLEGMLGGVVRVFGGKAAKEGITSTVAVKGNRKSRIDDLGGQIVDLGEEKVYTLDVKRKEYKVQTFAEIRAEWEKQKADAEKQMKNMKPEEKQQAEDAGKQMEVELKVEQTGQKKTIAGYDTHEAIMTVTTHEKGKTLEEAGGFVMTSDMWLAPKIAALDELVQFELKYVRAVYGEAFVADMQQMASMMAMYPSFKTMASQMQSEGRKLQGTPVSTTMTFETVAGAAQTKEAEKSQKDQKDQQDSSGGGGLGGMLGRKLMSGRGGDKSSANQTPGRTKIMTSTQEMLSVETSVSAADVALPDGFKLKK